MKRKSEKILLLLGSIWNIITALLTIFGYSDWFQKEGMSRFEHHNQVNYASVSLLDSLTKFIMIFGLVILVMGIITFLVTRFIDDNIINKKIIAWIIICIIVQFASFDLIGVFFYLSALVVYGARTKAYYKVKNSI
ncbi:DUF4064 domain-containing protein [Streptococcus gallolyticus]|uniref:DUF4064 domain-containing protein n=1 Tax=Streptococcus gallolyticus TaxID=315405 RepID=UPI00211C6C01|nr:DUF4064 domain-containing protein [Streptococcus gallolyticus]MCQ9216449.1 DUF4064 domain-containing protein [Streptococcus gallolyticus]